MTSNVLRRPIGKERIQQTLIATVKASLCHGEFGQFGECVHARLVHVHARIEAVWPTYIGSGRQFFPFEELIAILQNLNQTVLD